MLGYVGVMQASVAALDLLPHVRVILGILIGLAIARLLLGLADLPRRGVFLPHALWSGALLLELVRFWWWQFALFPVKIWTFGIFVYLVAYAVVLFMLCALLYPDRIADHGGYEAYFLERRRWFFSILGATFLFEAIDVAIRGAAHLQRFSGEYMVAVPVGIALCALAVWSPNRHVHLALAAAMLAYELSWLFRLFNTVA